jgi:hypothetical protein
VCNGHGLRCGGRISQAQPQQTLHRRRPRQTLNELKTEHNMHVQRSKLLVECSSPNDRHQHNQQHAFKQQACKAQRIIPAPHLPSTVTEQLRASILTFMLPTATIAVYSSTFPLAFSSLVALRTSTTSCGQMAQTGTEQASAGKKEGRVRAWVRVGGWGRHKTVGQATDSHGVQGATLESRESSLQQWSPGSHIAVDPDHVITLSQRCAYMTSLTPGGTGSCFLWTKIQVRTRRLGVQSG